MEGWKERDKTDSQRRLSLSRQWWQCKFGIVSPWKMPESLFTGLSALFSLHFRDIPFPASFPFNIRENGERLIVPRHPETPLLSARYRLPSSRLDRLGRLVGPRTGSVVFHGAPLPTKDGRARGCVRVWVWPLSLSLSLAYAGNGTGLDPVRSSRDTRRSILSCASDSIGIPKTNGARSPRTCYRWIFRRYFSSRPALKSRWHVEQLRRKKLGRINEILEIWWSFETWSVLLARTLFLVRGSANN